MKKYFKCKIALYIAGTTTESLIAGTTTAQYYSTYDFESCSVICFLIYCGQQSLEVYCSQFL